MGTHVPNDGTPFTEGRQTRYRGMGTLSHRDVNRWMGTPFPEDGGFLLRGMATPLPRTGDPLFPSDGAPLPSDVDPFTDGWEHLSREVGTALSLDGNGIFFNESENHMLSLVPPDASPTPEGDNSPGSRTPTCR